MNTQHQPIDLGTYRINPRDPRTKEQLRKYFDALMRDDFSYVPFEKVR